MATHLATTAFTRNQFVGTRIRYHISYRHEAGRDGYQTFVSALISQRGASFALVSWLLDEAQKDRLHNCISVPCPNHSAKHSKPSPKQSQSP